jgi:ketosteroid isomerase-like protein
MTSEEIDELASRLFSCIETGDIEGVADLYAPDVAIWHNVSGRSQTRDQNLKLLTHLRGRLDEWRYDEIRRDLFDGGFVQQHVLRARKRDGSPIEIPVCILVRTSGGRITRIDEYLDSRAADTLASS